MSTQTFTLSAMPLQAALGFPESLTEKYRPQRIDDFAGLNAKPGKPGTLPKPGTKAILRSLVRAPRDGGGWIFVGPSGTGKTSMGLALANEMNAELHHITSQNCNLETIERVWGKCHFVPMLPFSRHLILIDEADQMTRAAQIALLSKLDGMDQAPMTTVVLTCNSLDGLEQRFLSRNRPIEFSSYGIAKEATALLERVWDAETGLIGGPKPNFARIVKEANNNIRGALMSLELEIMAA